MLEGVAAPINRIRFLFSDVVCVIGWYLLVQQVSSLGYYSKIECCKNSLSRGINSVSVLNRLFSGNLFVSS